MIRIRVDSYQNILEKVDSDTIARILSSSDTEKSKRFHFQEDRDRFIAARVLFWMEILTQHTHTSEFSLPLNFMYNTYGKPSLEHFSTHFNWSHSGDIIAMTLGDVQVGIDVEEVPERPLFDYKSLCTQDELAWIQHQLRSELLSEKEAFIRIWSAKEAVLKAIGTGLSTDPRNVAIQNNELPGYNWTCVLHDHRLTGTSASFNYHNSSYALSWCSSKEGPIPDLKNHISHII
jgi:4'-phosphopantetheinyl transferase